MQALRKREAELLEVNDTLCGSVVASGITLLKTDHAPVAIDYKLCARVIAYASSDTKLLVADCASNKISENHNISSNYRRAAT